MKKDLYTIAYILTSVIIIGAAVYYVFFLQASIFRGFNEDPKSIAIAARQEAYSQQITKAAVGMGYSPNERNFLIFQAEISRVLPKWRKAHEALVSGSDELGIRVPSTTSKYESLQEDLKFFYNEININATNLQNIEYSTDSRDVNFLSLRGSIETLVNTVSKYQQTAEKVTNFIVDQSQIDKSGFSLVEKIVLLAFLGVILLQGFFIFRPMVKLAGDNYLSANKAFQTVKQSEQKLKISFLKQKKINKQLILSRRELETKNKKLKESESKLLKSTEEQIAINERLLKAQEEIKVAYQKLQDSEEEIRELADKQLQDNEKLFLAEKKLKELLDDEKKAKGELNNALEALKSTQSQLVHSEKMASLGQLTAGIAHEINNPINFISSGMNSLKMSIESMREILDEYERIDDGENPKEVLEDIKELKEDHEYDDLIDELDELIKDINYGVTRTIEIVKGLRVFSRLDEEEVKQANVNENIDATLTLLRNKTKNKIKISKFYDDKMKDIECFPGQLNQVFMNILNNGIQAIPEERKDGEITIYTEEEDNQVVIRLKDNGVGIPEDIKNRIWEPFFTTKPVGVGTGLGMSITFGIIEKHNGKIELFSEVGKGTEFVITLPKKIVKKDAKDKEPVSQDNNS